MNTIKFSLRYKVMLLLTGLCFASLAIFSYVALKTFKSDKVAYVFDASLQKTRLTAKFFHREFKEALTMGQVVAQGLDLSSKTMSPGAQDFIRSYANLIRVDIVLEDETKGPQILYQYGTTSNKENLRQLMAQYQKDPASYFITFSELSAHSYLLLLKGKTEDGHTLWNIFQFQSAEASDSLEQTSNFSTLLLDAEKGRLVGDSSKLDPILRSALTTWPQSLFSNESTKPFVGTSQKRYLASIAAVGIGKYFVVNIVKEDAAFAAVERLAMLAGVFALGLFSVILLISFYSSRRITSDLADLSEATQKIAKGDFNVRFDSKSNDEVGALSNGFNLMASEVGRLMSETVEKARMEAELKTAQTVQNTLFPATRKDYGAVKIVGHYASASECGGDWWYYHRNGDKVFLWIGDATGHGAPAALITSAARAAASLVDWQPNVSPGQAMRILNRAIYATSKGSMMMTFFIACLDIKTNKLTYSNASHNPPFLIQERMTKDTLSKADFEPLVEANNPRLGQSEDHFFTESTISISPGDFLVLFTDGVVEMKNKEGKDLGERKYLKILSQFLCQEKDMQQAMNSTLAEFERHRDNYPLEDDVTMVFASFDGETSLSKVA